MVDATFMHKDGYKFRQVYRSKKSFLASLKRSKGITFINAVDFNSMMVVKPETLGEYAMNK